MAKYSRVYIVESIGYDQVNLMPLDNKKVSVYDEGHKSIGFTLPEKEWNNMFFKLIERGETFDKDPKDRWYTPKKGKQVLMTLTLNGPEVVKLN